MLFSFLPHRVASNILILFVPALLAVATDLYPTQPVASTTFHGGQPSVIQWNGGQGTYMIDLMNGSDVLIYPISKSVSAREQRLVTTIPQIVGVNGNQYYVKFIPLDGISNLNVVYSSRFSLDNMKGSMIGTPNRAAASQQQSPVAGSSFNTHTRTVSPQLAATVSPTQLANSTSNRTTSISSSLPSSSSPSISHASSLSLPPHSPPRFPLPAGSTGTSPHSSGPTSGISTSGNSCTNIPRHAIMYKTVLLALVSLGFCV